MEGDDGAVLVEFALIMPILMIFLFGIVEFGVNLNDFQSLRQAVREGARQAVVGDYGTNSTCPTVGLTAGTPTSVKQVICTTKARSGVGNQSDVRVKVVVTNAAAPDATSTTYTNDNVKICVAKKASSITGLLSPFLNSVVLKSSIQMRAEKELSLGAAEGASASYEETYPSSSGNWAQAGC
jgi:Flp pilus assembly protein TadG